MTKEANRDALAEQVRELLSTILHQADFPGSVELLMQASSVRVIGGPVTMLQLQVGEALHASAFPEGPAPLSAVVSDSADTIIGELLVWVESGYLSALEFAWWTEEPPGQLPATDRIKVTRK